MVRAPFGPANHPLFLKNKSWQTLNFGHRAPANQPTNDHRLTLLSPHHLLPTSSRKSDPSSPLLLQRSFRPGQVDPWSFFLFLSPDFPVAALVSIIYAPSYFYLRLWN
jgi:hypothetical protein